MVKITGVKVVALKILTRCRIFLVVNMYIGNNLPLESRDLVCALQNN